MEPLLKQLRELPARLKSLPAATRNLLLGGIVLVAAIAMAIALAGRTEYEYAFTNLTTEDGTEAAGILGGAGIPYRLEAGGGALAVPADKVYEARLLLASAGLPRAGGVGFELFDRGDIGVSEFTQRVNLRRAIEGELARTIGALAEVRNARVHVTLAEKGLYREDDREASASVVVNLHPGRTLGDRELAGIRHLVASAVPGLVSRNVTVVDGRGTVLTAQDDWAGTLASHQRQIEADLERRIVAILEPAVGRGAVVARVTAVVDASEESSQSEIYDPDGAVVRNERTVVSTQVKNAGGAAGVAGAAGNQPGAPGAIGGANRGESNVEDESRSFEVSRTVTQRVRKVPQLQRLSVAVLLDGVDGTPRPADEVERLGALARRAIGFDEKRGDQFEIASVIFASSAMGEGAEGAETAIDRSVALSEQGARILVAVVAAALLVGFAFAARTLLRRRRKATEEAALDALRDDTAAALAAAEAERQALPDPAVALRDRARELASLDPQRAAHLLRAWIQADLEQQQQQQQAAREEVVL